MKLLLVLGLICTSTFCTWGLQPLGGGFNSHCKCLSLESRVIPKESLRSVQILRRGPHCKFTEVIAGLVSGEKICLDPRTNWVMKLVRFIERRSTISG